MAARSLLAGIVLFVPLVAQANPKGRANPAPSGTAHVWLDGSRERTVWLNPRLVAEFGSAGATPEGAKTATPGGAAIRIWELDPGQDVEAVLLKARNANPASRYSPVLQDGKAGGRLRALPGNVIVTLDAITDEPAAREWADGMGLELLSRVHVGPNRWLVKSDAGFPSLELANTLAETPGVSSASPVWWQETTTR